MRLFGYDIGWVKERGAAPLPSPQRGKQEVRGDTPALPRGVDGGVLAVGRAYVSSEMAMKFTAVYAAIRLRSETIANLPKEFFRIEGKSRISYHEHDVYRLLKYRPNGWMSVFTFWEYVNSCLDGWGNAFVLIKRSRNGIPGELIPVHPKFLDVLFDNATLKKWYRVTGTGSKELDGMWGDEDVCHFFGLSFDGIKGVNPIVYNSAAIQSGICAQNYGNEFYATGGNVKAVLETDKNISAAQGVEFVKMFNDTKNHGTPLLDQSIKYKTVGISPEAAQMLETRTFALQDIARIFNVPPNFLGDLSRSTFSNVEQQDIQFAKNSILPSVKRYEKELDRKLLFSDEYGTAEVSFNMNGMMRGDMAARSAFYHNAVLDGWMTRNEVRELEQMNDVAGLDAFLYPSNMEKVKS